ncbi:MAG: hypothetical protein PHX82_02825 [Paracoccaceae bacterium]|nr:hypothetical protein [Paracoccaceae bacterium]
MDETDSFINEVTEEVRRDKLFAALRKYGWIGVVAALAIVGGAAFNEWSKSKAQAESEAFGDAILAAVQADAPRTAFETISADGARASVVALMAAAEATADDDMQAALAAYRQIAADPATPASLRDLARLKAVIVTGTAMDPAERESELVALAQPGAPYRLLAIEAQANAALAAGDPDQAITLARQILNDAEVTAGLQQRATELIVALGGDPAAK